LKPKRTIRRANASRLSVPERHQLKIARDTLKMPDAMVGVMGGMTKVQAREIFRRLMAKARGERSNPRRRNARQVTAYGVVTGHNTRGQKWQQEHYESKSGDARVRAAQLRKLGFRVSVSPQGAQVTPQGMVRMTMITIDNVDPDHPIPAPDRVERFNPRSGTLYHVIGKMNSRRRRNFFQETVKEGSRAAIITANEASGPFQIRLYVNNGETATTRVKKAKTIAGARKAARKMLDDYLRSVQNPRVETYTLKAGDGSGRRVRKATRVIFEDGRRVSFIERLPKKKAIEQAAALLARKNSVTSGRRKNKSIEEIGPGRYRVDNEHGTTLTLIKKPWGWEVQADNIRARVAWRGPGVHTFRSLAEVEKKYKAFRGISSLAKENPRRRKNYITITGERTPEAQRKMLKAAAEIIRTAGWDAMAREFEEEPAKRKRIASFISKDITKRWGMAKGLKAYEYLISVSKWLEGKGKNPDTPTGAMIRSMFGSRPATGTVVDSIRAGDRVTIVNRFGQKSTGRAVMPSSNGGWVLNMGGAHGTPGIATAENIVKVVKRKNSKRNTVAWGKSDQTFVQQALRQLFPGKQVWQLKPAQLSQVMQLAQQLKTGKKNPVRKVAGGWQPIGTRGRMGPVLPTQRDAEIYAESLRNPPPKKLSAAAAAQLGAAAFKAGKKRVPVHDPELMRRLQPGPVGTNRAALTGWLRGWDTANIRSNPRLQNYGEGDLFNFHGAFREKADAVAKEAKTPGAFIKTVWYKDGPRYGVVTKRAQNAATCGFAIGRYKCSRKPNHRGPHLPQGATLRPRSRVPGKWVGRRRNYADSTELYEKFHGKEATRVTDTGLPTADYDDHPELGALGRLVSLIIGDEEAEKPWKKKIEWKNGEAPDLAAEPGGRQLYIVGGSQDLDSFLESLPGDSAKEELDLGEAYRIEYFTQKKFDNFQPVTYYHDLGEETGERPRVVYDRVKKRIHIVGGAYEVKPEGIVN
jgi:hypothetical protein